MTENTSNLPKIEGKVLEDSDIGRNVWYVPNNAKNGDYSEWQRGILFAFETHENGQIYVSFQNMDPESIKPQNLKWSK